MDVWAKQKCDVYEYRSVAPRFVADLSPRFASRATTEHAQRRFHNLGLRAALDLTPLSAATLNSVGSSFAINSLSFTMFILRKVGEF